MSSEKIALLQNILEQKNRFDLSYKFENSYFKSDCYDGWNGGLYKIIFYVDSKYFFELSKLDEENRNFLVEILNALDFDNIGEITHIDFKINTKLLCERLNNILYIFVDESGDMDFSTKGSKYYMFSFLLKKRPFKLHEVISSYRYSLLERNLTSLNQKRLDIEKFHACEDNKHIREHLFNLISNFIKFEKEPIKIYSYILEKPKVLPEKTKDDSNFYSENLRYAIIKFLEKINIANDFIIITDNLPVRRNKNKQIGAIKSGIKHYLEEKKIKVRYDIFHHSSASSVNLQIVDYINWAIHRKYEKGDEYFYNKIKAYIIEEEVMTKDRTKEYY